MKEEKKETHRIQIYRHLLASGNRGVTNGEFCYKHRLPCNYRKRISELREEMDLKYGLGPGGPGKGWIPRKRLLPLRDNIYRWTLTIPPDADARDPLGLLNLPLLQKKFDKSSSVDENEGEQLELLTTETGGDHDQAGNEGSEEAHQEGAGQAACPS